MPKMSTVLGTAARWSVVAMAAAFMTAAPAKAEWNKPWQDESRALVIDAYEFNPINWSAMTKDERIAGFISKASDGLPPAWSCRGMSGDDERLCKNRWWKYSVTQELYFTRREMAKMLGLKWGAYHLGRPGNPREQADHFIDFTKPEDDELIALDIEDNDPENWMSLADAEIFAEQIKIRLGRYPVLYTNGSTADYISKNAEDYPLLSRLPLWYARYRDDITGKFPEETWPSYALWQFASMHNCNERSCPYRVDGAKTDIDVNVSPLTVAELKAAWPFNDLVGDAPEPVVEPDAGALIAEAASEAHDAVSAIGEFFAASSAPNEANADELDEARSMMMAAYAPTGMQRQRDPLQRLTDEARKNHQEAQRSPILSKLTTAPERVAPDMPGDAPRRQTPPMRTHDVAAGLIDASNQLKAEMAKVRQILVPAAAANENAMDRPVVSVNEPGPDEEAVRARSRIAERLREAVEEAEASLKSPQEKNAALAEDGSEKGAWSIRTMKNRIASVFEMTR